MPIIPKNGIPGIISITFPKRLGFPCNTLEHTPVRLGLPDPRGPVGIANVFQKKINKLLTRILTGTITKEIKPQL